jgi:hypothetical protein
MPEESSFANGPLFFELHEKTKANIEKSKATRKLLSTCGLKVLKERLAIVISCGFVVKRRLQRRQDIVKYKSNFKYQNTF